MATEVSSRSLTIHLSKEKQRRNSLIKPAAGTIEKRIPLGKGIEGRPFIKAPTASPPSWADLFEEHVDAREFGKSSSPGAALIVPVKERWVAVTFGQGRHLLSSDTYLMERI